MRRFLSFFCFFILISAVSFAEDTMKVEAEGFTIRVPLGWMAQYTKTPCVFMLYSPVEENDTFQENGNLVVEALPGKSSIKTYMEQSIAAIREMYKNPKVLEAKENYHVIAGQINETLVQQIRHG